MSGNAASFPMDMAELFVTRAAEWARAETQDSYGIGAQLGYALTEHCESPIEQRLLVELLFAFQQFYAVTLNDPDYAEAHELDDENIFGPRADIALTPQFPASPFRIDIAVHVLAVNHKIMRIAVECDGHDFHERTKQQAARDRKRDRVLQQLGWFVFRFTGSEIFRDGKACALEVANHAARWQGEQYQLTRAAYKATHDKQLAEAT